LEQVFRIEIPVEAVDNTDVAALQRLETTLTKLFNTMKNSKTGIDGVFDAIETGAVGNLWRRSKRGIASFLRENR